MTNLQKKIDFAIHLIQSASKVAARNGCPEIEVAYSGGKDSDVILELAKMAGVPYRAIYKNTTIDPPGTIRHAKDMGAEILQPEMSFAQLIEKYGLPNRRKRFCCAALKEYKVLDYCIIGVRRAESPQRANRYHEPEQCRVLSKKEKVRQYFPILEWSDQDIEAFISERGIKCAPVYYDEQGKFHVERRLGCMCCPLLYYKKRIEQFKRYPGILRLYRRHGERYLRIHQHTKTGQLYGGNIDMMLVRDIFYEGNTDGWNRLVNGIFPPPADSTNKSSNKHSM